MRVIIIDDEPKAIEVIQRYIEKISFLELQSSFRDPLKAVTWWQNNRADLVFVDINMPNLSGLKIRQFMPEPQLIFTTAYSEFAVESYELNATDYLVKPILFDRFLKAALKAHNLFELKSSKMHGAAGSESVRREKHRSTLFIKSGTKHYQLVVQDIQYIEKDGNYVTFYLPQTKVLARLTMQQVMDLLPDGFIQVHKSYIVNIAQVRMLEHYQLLIAEKRIPISKSFRDKVMDALR